MGNIETKKTLPQPQARLKNIEIFGDSQKSDKALYGKETYMKGYYILDNCHFVAIYDGHGYYGGSAAHDANEILMGYFEENRKVLNELSSDKEVKDFILDGFRQIQQKLSQNVIYHKSGTCCIGVLILENKLYIINIGNSRAVLCTKTASGLKAVELSKDHVISCSEERERVTKRGLKIYKVQEKGKEHGVERLWIDKEGPGITATRTLGDAQLSKIITSEPEIEEYMLNPNDSFLILGSDGLWDVMSSEDAVIMLTQEKKGKEAVETLVKNAKKRWRDKVQTQSYIVGDDPQDIGKTDDVTAVVCYFNFPSEEEMEVLGRFNFLFENKHARLRELKQSLENK